VECFDYFLENLAKSLHFSRFLLAYYRQKNSSSLGKPRQINIDSNRHPHAIEFSFCQCKNTKMNKTTHLISSLIAVVALAVPSSAHAQAATSAASTRTGPTRLYLPLPGEKGGRWLLLDGNHKPLRETDIISLLGYRVDEAGLLPTPAQTVNERWGYLDAKGQWAIPSQYENARSFSPDGLARFQQSGKWGYLGKDLKVRIPAQFEEARGFVNGMAPVRKGKLWGFIDTSGTVVVPPTYDVVWDYAKNGLARVRKNDKDQGFIDRTGKRVTSANYDYALGFGGVEVSPAKEKDKGDKDGRWGLIDAQGNWVLKPKYETIDLFNAQQLAAVRKTWREIGYINAQGKEIIAPREGISEFMAANRVRFGSPGSSSFSFLDEQGRAAFAGTFDWVGHFSQSAQPIPARRNGEWGLLTVAGKWLPVGAGREPLFDGDKIDRSAQSEDLTVWLNPRQAIEWLDANAKVVYRLEPAQTANKKGQTVRLTHAEKVVWQSNALNGELSLSAFFEPQVDDLMDKPFKDVVPLARKLLDTKPRKFVPYSLIFGERRDPYDLKDVDEDVVEDAKLGAIEVLASTYVSETQWGSFYFLADQREKQFDKIHKRVCDELTKEFGTPLAKPPEASLTPYSTQGKPCVWQVGQRWLSTYSHHDTGDGDFEHQVVLLAVPISVDKKATLKR
jgi:hypothetical protein